MNDSWVYISPRTGEVLRDMDARRRLYRWLFDGLHRWDFDVLIRQRPLWDIWMWLWLIIGAIISVSGIVIGMRRLWRPTDRRTSGIGGRRHQGNLVSNCARTKHSLTTHG